MVSPRFGNTAAAIAVAEVAEVAAAAAVAAAIAVGSHCRIAAVATQPVGSSPRTTGAAATAGAGAVVDPTWSVAASPRFVFAATDSSTAASGSCTAVPDIVGKRHPRWPTAAAPRRWRTAAVRQRSACPR